jgi:hypothetical protein
MKSKRSSQYIAIVGILFESFVLFSSCQNQSPMTKGKVEGYEVGLSTSPAKPVEGSNQFKVFVHDASGKPVNGARVVVEYFMSPGPNAPLIRGSASARESRGGEYTTEMNLPKEGEWTVSVHVAPPKGNDLLDANFELSTGHYGARFIG